VRLCFALPIEAVNERKLDHHLKGSELLLEMLGRGRLRAPALSTATVCQESGHAARTNGHVV